MENLGEHRKAHLKVTRLHLKPDVWLFSVLTCFIYLDVCVCVCFFPFPSVLYPETGRGKDLGVPFFRTSHFSQS